MRLTYTPNMLRNVPGEIEGFHYFVQVYNILGNMSFNFTSQHLACCAYMQPGAAGKSTLFWLKWQWNQTYLKVNRSTFHKDKVDIESPCFCDHLLSFHRTSNFMHPLISFPICSNYALEVKFLSTLQTYSLLLFNVLLKWYTKLQVWAG